MQIFLECFVKLIREERLPAISLSSFTCGTHARRANLRLRTTAQLFSEFEFRGFCDEVLGARLDALDFRPEVGARIF